MALCSGCGRNFILPSAAKPLEPIFEEPTVAAVSIVKRMLIGAAVSWVAYVLLIAGSVLSVLLDLNFLKWTIGLLFLVGYLPCLLVATIYGWCSTVADPARGRVMLCILAMWLPLGLSVLGMILPYFQK